MKHFVATVLLSLCCLSAEAQFSIVDHRPQWRLDGKSLLTTPREGLWSVATAWRDSRPADWIDISPQSESRTGEWTILGGKAQIGRGTLLVRDAYRTLTNGLTQCIRRYEWLGPDTLRHTTLSVRLQLLGDTLMPLLPGILYYGNHNGASVNPNHVAVYRGTPGEFALFEDHRYPQPFAMLENGAAHYAAALHTTPSPIRGACHTDQWWSMGVEAFNGYSELVLMSGTVGYNGLYSVVKALQTRPMPYPDTYIDMEPGRIVEKQYYVDLYRIAAPGTGFERPLYTSIAMHGPYDADRFERFDNIIRSKYRFALTRWLDGAAAGFDMYDTSRAKELVMGWCGQAEALGFALQALEKRLGDTSIVRRVQRSLDFLSDAPMKSDGLFAVRYNLDRHEWYEGDPVSCGQAMYSFARAIATARKDHRYNPAKWERFLRTAADSASRRILSSSWNPRSTAEGFYIAPLVLASKLFKNNTYRAAAVKAGELYATRHLHDASYWGGTLDATCEDKEGAWAAFQGFLALYEHYREPRFMQWAKHAMDVCLSYTVVWDIPLPAGRLADYGFRSTGWTVVSAQNQHLDVYGVVFAPEVYRMGQLLKNDTLRQLALVMYRSCAQLTDPYGSQGEQVQHTNFAQHGDMSDVYKLRGGYSENWTVFWITAHFLSAAAKFEQMSALDLPSK